MIYSSLTWYELQVKQYSTTFSTDFHLYIVDDEFGEKTVSILLDGEESEMIFIDHPHVEMSVSIKLFLKFI